MKIGTNQDFSHNTSGEHATIQCENLMNAREILNTTSN